MFILDTIIFLNTNLILINEIPKSYENRIIYALYKNEIILVICSKVKSIKTWIKKKIIHSFIQKIIINNVYDN